MLFVRAVCIDDVLERQFGHKGEVLVFDLIEGTFFEMFQRCFSMQRIWIKVGIPAIGCGNDIVDAVYW